MSDNDQFMAKVWRPKDSDTSEPEDEGTRPELFEAEDVLWDNLEARRDRRGRVRPPQVDDV